MCKYCETDSNKFSISFNGDRYYESQGLDCDGETSNSINVFDVKYCPFCGKRLSKVYEPHIFLYIINRKKDNRFVESIPWLHDEFDYYKRTLRDDSSDDSYYLFLKVKRLIRKKLDKNPHFISLVYTKWYTNAYDEKPKAQDFKEIKDLLSDGKDVFVAVNYDYKHLEYLIERLNKLKHSILKFDSEYIKESKVFDKSIIIPTIFHKLNLSK